MNVSEPQRDDEPILATRRVYDPAALAASLPPSPVAPAPVRQRSLRRWLRAALALVVLLILAAAAGVFYARHWVRAAVAQSLPQIDGSLIVPGLAEAVTVQRDARGVPSIRAASTDDLVFAQGFVTAQDRLFQMDILRRHAAGTLAEILGPAQLSHDKLQRTLQIRAAADRAVAALPQDQLHLLEQYAGGVNAAIAQQKTHLPIEFHVLRYTPAPWTPRDSMLITLAMFQDLTQQWPTKIARESLSARLPPELVADLFPVGSWRDHPPSSAIPDLTIPGPPIEQVPLDESQATGSAALAFKTPAAITDEVQSLIQSPCPDCTPGSNNWVVSGAHTASGKPMLSNDMHLNLTIPGIWYQVNLESPTLHVAGVALPGLPLIVVGHNQHIAWGFTVLGGDVQDIYIETTRNPGPEEEFLATDNTWQPVVHLPERIVVKGGRDVKLDVTATRHGEALTPILTPLLTPAAAQGRTLALRWTIYDPAVLQLPLLAINSAHDWPGFLAGFAQFGGPSQNVVYADDQGHIGFHAVGKVPLRGPARNPSVALPDDIATPVTPRPADESPTIAANPSPLAGTDLQAAAPTTPQLSGPLSGVPLAPTAAHEWSGYIPFDQLPQAFDPPGGVLATANARTAPDDFPYPITLNWASPYRAERLYHALAHRTGLTEADMLALQMDIYSDFEHVLAQRLAYALDHSHANFARKQQAADLLRNFNGRMTTDSSAAAIVYSVHNALWPLLIGPHLAATGAPTAHNNDVNNIYLWGERDYALEQILMHTPPRWLPPNFANWDDFLASAVDHALTDAKAPSDLATWRYGSFHFVDVEHPVFDQSAALQRLYGKPTGTGPQPLSGDTTTVKQVAKTFGPSERFTVDFADLDHATMNLPFGQSGNPDSPWFLNQFQAWLHGSTYPMPFSQPAVDAATTHTLMLTPR